MKRFGANYDEDDDEEKRGRKRCNGEVEEEWGKGLAVEEMGADRG